MTDLANDPTVFKTAVVPAESDNRPPGVKLPGLGSTEKLIEPSTLPPSLYAEAGRLPLIAEKLGLQSFYEKFDTKELSTEVNSFINEEIKRLHLKDDQNTYTELLNTYEKKLNVENLDDPFVKLEKISQYVRIQQQLQETMREHDELLAADPGELSLAKLKKFMELKYGMKSV